MMQDLTHLVLLKQHNRPCLPLLCWPLNSPHKVMERRKQKHENIVELINVSWFKKKSMNLNHRNFMIIY